MFLFSTGPGPFVGRNPTLPHRLLLGMNYGVYLLIAGVTAMEPPMEPRS